MTGGWRLGIEASLIELETLLWNMDEQLSPRQRGLPECGLRSRRLRRTQPGLPHQLDPPSVCHSQRKARQTELFYRGRRARCALRSGYAVANLRPSHVRASSCGGILDSSLIQTACEAGSVPRGVGVEAK